MARNKLSDLNDHLFAQLERLEDENMSREDLEKEVVRTKAINDVAKNIVENAKLTLEAVKLTGDLPQKQELPKLFKASE